MSAKAKKRRHVVMGGKGLRCLNCGAEEDAHFPVRIEVLKAIGKAFEKEHARCEPSEAGKKRFEFSTPWEWLHSWDTGIASKTLCAFFTGGSIPIADRGVPHDPDDFGRCYRLLAKFPEWKLRFPQFVAKHPEWTALVANWEHLEKLYEEELPTGSAPKLYDFMKALVPA